MDKFNPYRLAQLSLVLATFLLSTEGLAQTATPVLRLYLIPGTGADERLFHQLDLTGYDTVNVELPVAKPHERLADYAARIAREQIDTTLPFAILGVSLGGMVATELAEQLSPVHVVIVASAKTRQELPPGYRLGRFLPVYRVVGGRTMRWFTKRSQPQMEPMLDAQRDLFMDMIYAKDPKFLQRAVGMMVRWDRKVAPAGITHVHGTLDHTLPFKYVCADVEVLAQGHMLTYSQPALVEQVLAKALISSTSALLTER